MERWENHRRNKCSHKTRHLSSQYFGLTKPMWWLCSQGYFVPDHLRTQEHQRWSIRTVWCLNRVVVSLTTGHEGPHRDIKKRQLIFNDLYCEDKKLWHRFLIRRLPSSSRWKNWPSAWIQMLMGGSTLKISAMESLLSKVNCLAPPQHRY